MKTVTTIIIMVAVVVGATIGLAYSGLYDVSASSPHSGFVNWFLSTTSHASVERRAREIEVPNLDDEVLVLAGANDYDSMCAGCHGAPGTNPDAVGQGLNPPAPDLTEEAAEMTPAELFWVTKNGIKMTGMPAWGVTHEDDAIWPVVAFMTKLPELDQSAYQTLLGDAKGVGHHGDDAVNSEHSHAESDVPSSDAAHDHADSGDHEHGDSTQSEDMSEAADEHDHDAHQH
jgi:mono/diheme cytochrome c family protein